MFLEQLYGQADEVIEVHRLVGTQGVLIGLISECDLAFGLVHGGVQGATRGEQGVLPVGDGGCGLAQTVLVAGLEYVGQNLLGVRRVEHREARLVADAARLMAQDLQAQGMKGGDGEAFSTLAGQQFTDAFAHFPRGLVGEGDGGDVAGVDAAFAH